ncbi:bile acid:sodium symporter family protein [Thalassoglobus polymorphus]|uniref:Sodium Bile acid symporter family protein n=1 Tax=Thalassoglobus polymorphus TaxID=2527994 RepID=A0A517QHK3_9PLAN|nr:bile acid:sodium symporter family protein [Thalassoglobus polymorphus]QDT31122.1 Sodium Bile acid symporter family protein [Thalassoglobus polymorphus]
MLQRYLLFWLVLSSVVAGVWPNDVPDPFLISKTWLGGLVAVVMFCVGTLLPKDEVLNVLKRWPLVIGGTAIQYAAMPFLAWLMATKVFGFTGDLMIGVILVGCVPGAMASNVLTMVARGNVSYSVGLTTSATLLSPLIVPIAMKLTLGKAVDAELLTNTAITLVKQVVIPVIAGFTLAQVSQTVAKYASKFSGTVANFSILWIIAVVVAVNRDNIQQLPLMLMWALLLINLGGYLCGQLGGRVLGIDSGMRRALMLEIGMQNAGIGASLAKTLFPDQPEIALPCGLFAFGCMTTGTIFAEILKHFPPPETSQSSEKQTALTATAEETIK